jgi:hypothetical protein
LLCTAGETGRALGPLRLVNYRTGYNPLSTIGFATFTPPLSQLAGPDVGGIPDPIEDAFVVLRIRPPGASQVVLELEPDIVMPDRRYQITLYSDDGVTQVGRMAFGLVAPGPVDQLDMKFVSCEQPSNTIPLAIPAEFDGSMRGCPVSPEGSTTVFAPTAFDSSEVAVIATYSVGPGPEECPADPTADCRQANTLYVALQSLPSVPLNSATGGGTKLGVVEFAEPTPTPQFTFEGVESLPGFDTGAIQLFNGGGPVSTNNVTLVNSYSPDEDSDNDQVPDDLDNCVLVQNGGPGGQLDRGGVGFKEDNRDRIGDACTCADLGNDGVVDNGSLTEDNDVQTCQELLASLVADPVAQARCRVTAVGDSFGIVDLVVLELETHEPNSSGAGNPEAGSLQRCSLASGQ